jgi:hypothetical protein
MAERENVVQAYQRWADLELLQKHYAKFEDFLIDVIEGVMGFTCTDTQIDIGQWIAYGPQYRMVQAQRGQAKTTITAAYAVWKIIHDPTTRVLIISAGSTQATEVANWIIQIIDYMPELACLRPDASQGDRESVTAYDIHYSLKGPEKSPSISCIGITSSMQGKRADVLIADDIESSKNTQTAVQRERIVHLSLDFSSINSKGDIIYLGTPQSIDSLYNGLPGRGVSVRIWPGRFPTVDELPDYEGFIAPYILDMIKRNPGLQIGGGPTGQRGQPVDAVIMDEENLTKKEIDQGPAYFTLQYMLSTKLTDKDRYPLKLANIRFANFDREARRAPMALGFIRSPMYEIKKPDGFPLKDKMYRVAEQSDYGDIPTLMMYVDPAGGGRNGDETAYGITGFTAGRIIGIASGGVPGGFSDESVDALVAVAKKWNIKFMQIEQNYGHGALAAVIRPKLKIALPTCGIEEVWEAGQKELRIIDILEPIINAGKLILAEEMISDDWSSVQKYPSQLRQTYSLIWQMARVTRDKGSLIHDDRLDAFAGACRPWAEHVAIDDAKAVAAAKNAAYRKLMSNPLGDGRPLPGNFGIQFRHSAMNALSRVGQNFNLRKK